MGFYKELDGDLIKLSLEGKFDVIVQGNNCFCVQGAGLAPQFVKAFGSDKFKMEAPEFKGDINKLGTIDYEVKNLYKGEIGIDKSTFFTKQGYIEPSKVSKLVVINSYTQYGFGANHANGSDKPVDYDAITMVMKKINHIFKGKHIGLPLIGCGLAGGDFSIVSKIIKTELKDCDVTIVNYVK